MPDKNGDEADHYDEAFCPHDLAEKNGQWDNQTSADAYIGGTYHGAFTYYWGELGVRLAVVVLL